MRGVTFRNAKPDHTRLWSVRIDVKTTSIGGKPNASAFALAA